MTNARPRLTRSELAAAFHVVPLTITKWQGEGLPIAVQGSKGRATLYDLSACLAWYIGREVTARGGGNGNGHTLSPNEARALLDQSRRAEIELRWR